MGGKLSGGKLEDPLFRLSCGDKGCSGLGEVSAPVPYSHAPAKPTAYSAGLAFPRIGVEAKRLSAKFTALTPVPIMKL